MSITHSKPGSSRDEPLGRRAGRGGVVTIAGQVAGNVVRFGSNLVLTRLLLPEHFGIVALVGLLITGLHMLSDVGLGAALVQHPRGDEAVFHRTAFTVQAIRGAVLALAAVALAWPMSAFYGLPDLAWMVPVAAAAPLIEGFASTKTFRENRHLRLGRVTLIEVGSQVVSAVTMAIVAWQTRHLASLLVGSIAGVVFRVVLSHLWLPGARDGFAWDPEARGALMQFGRWMLVSTAITFAAMQLDRLVLGRLVTPEALGVYSIAVVLALVPREVIARLSSQVGYPLASRLLEGSGFAETIRATRIRVLATLALPLGVLVGAAEGVVSVLYDARYTGAGALVALLSLGTWLNVVATSYGVVVLARGWPRWISYGTGLKALTFVVLAVPVHRAYGLNGIAALAAGSEIAVATFAAFGARSLGVTSPGADLALTLAVVATAGVTHVARTWLDAALGTPLPGVLLAGAVAAIALLTGIHRFARPAPVRPTATEEVSRVPAPT